MIFRFPAKDEEREARDPAKKYIVTIKSITIR